MFHLSRGLRLARLVTRIHRQNSSSQRRKQGSVFREGARHTTHDLDLPMMLYLSPVSVKMLCAPIEMRGHLRN
jgi:hypothetical protein